MYWRGSIPLETQGSWRAAEANPMCHDPWDRSKYNFTERNMSRKTSMQLHVTKQNMKENHTLSQEEHLHGKQQQNYEYVN